MKTEVGKCELCFSIPLPLEERAYVAISCHGLFGLHSGIPETDNKVHLESEARASY